jgi:8-oxo-dGTP pyrophosphatase MutT (NUDIX family)
MIFSPDQIRAALELPNFDAERAQRTMLPNPRGGRPPNMAGEPRQGAVMVILYIYDGVTQLLLTKRRDDLNDHAGQVSFPGGRREEGEPLQMTALREAQEELSIEPSYLTVLGRLACLYIPPTDFEVYPFVAWHDGRPSYYPQESEVAEVLEVPLVLLLDPANRFEESWQIRGFQVEVPYFLVKNHKVWGATAMMLGELLERLRHVESGSLS